MKQINTYVEAFEKYNTLDYLITDEDIIKSMHKRHENFLTSVLSQRDLEWRNVIKEVIDKHHELYESSVEENDHDRANDHALVIATLNNLLNKNST